MNILITGAQGFIASYLIRHLRGQHTIYALDLDCREEHDGDGVQWIAADLTQPLALERLPRALDAVIHLAQSRFYRNFPEKAGDIFAVNTAATLHLLEYARQSGAASFLLASTGGVYADSSAPLRETSPVNPVAFYPATKYAAELLLWPYRQFFRPVIFRFFFVYGPAQQGMLIASLLRKLLDDEPITISGNPGLALTPTFVTDAVRAIEAAVLSPAAGVFNVAGDEVVTLTELVHLLEEVTGKQARLSHTPEQPGGALLGDASRMKEALGISPRVPLAEGLRQCYAALRQAEAREARGSLPDRGEHPPRPPEGKPMKILTIIGARPQFIKAAIVSRHLRQQAGISETLVHTGQHYDPAMSEVFFRELALPVPLYNLEVGSGNHGAQTAKMLEGLEWVMLAQRPELVLVYGDTNSTLAGALAAAKLHIPVAHVEAGLRSFNRAMPEEINRVMTDHLAEILFAPTETAVANLRREGLPEAAIHLIGDVMYDAMQYYRVQAEQQSTVLARCALTPGAYVLATIHRAENTDDPARLREILSGLQHIAAVMPVILPLHPRTRHILEQAAQWASLDGLLVSDPLGYLDLVMLEQHAFAIATDSGGIQKEAFFVRVPCLTLRDETEWVETVAAGANHLVGADAQRLDAAFTRLRTQHDTLPDPGPYYGNGRAAERIVEILTKSF